MKSKIIYLPVIIENGEQLDVTEAEIQHLYKEIQVIYKCPECKCYHIKGKWNMDDIEKELKDQKVEEFAKSLKPRRKKCEA